MRPSRSKYSIFDKMRTKKKTKTKQLSSFKKKKSAAHDVCQLHCTCLIPQWAINRERASETPVIVCFVATIQTLNWSSFDCICSRIGLNKENWTRVMYMFTSYEVALSLSTAPIPGEECSPVTLRLAEPWSRAGLGCLAAALATLFRDGERHWRADTLLWSALLTATSREERQDYTNMQTSVTCTAERLICA